MIARTSSRYATVVAIDPGMATLGLVGVETDTMEHRLVCGRYFETPARVGTSWQRDGRVWRSRDVRAFVREEIRRLQPHAVVMEEFGFLQGQHSTACLAMAYAAIDGECSHLNVLACTAKRARDELAGLQVKRQHTSTKGMSKSDALAAKKRDREVNRRATEEREQRAQREAIRRVAGAQQFIDTLRKTDAKHVADALVLFCWGIVQPMMREYLMDRLRHG